MLPCIHNIHAMVVFEMYKQQNRRFVCHDGMSGWFDAKHNFSWLSLLFPHNTPLLHSSSELDNDFKKKKKEVKSRHKCNLHWCTRLFTRSITCVLMTSIPPLNFPSMPSFPRLFLLVHFLPFFAAGFLFLFIFNNCGSICCI